VNKLDTHNIMYLHHAIIATFTSREHNILLGCIAVLRMQMRPIVTNQVAWSVDLSVILVSPAKTAAPIEMPFGLRTQVG